MLRRHWLTACAVFAVLAFLRGGAIAQNAAPQAPQPATVQPAKPFVPQVDTAAITKRANDSVGLDIQAQIKSWQTDIDKIEEALRKPNPTYAILDGHRDELIKLRTEGDEFWKKLEPPLSAMEDQVQKLPPAPAQDQPPSPSRPRNSAPISTIISVF